MTESKEHQREYDCGATLRRRGLLLGALSLVAAPSVAAMEVDFTLKDKAKWRSFGEKNWVFNDPFERSRPGAVRLPYSEWKLRGNQGKVAQLLDLIAFAEAGRKQYNAIHMSASRLPPARPTELTIAQIYVWIRKTPGQHHAIGRYQFIPSTLRALVRRAKLPTNAKFTPRVQDQLAGLLLQDAGYTRMLRKEISLDRFMDNLAGIWAGLPLRNGKSRYRGVAGNRATISRRFFSSQVGAIFL